MAMFGNAACRRLHRGVDKIAMTLVGPARRSASVVRGYLGLQCALVAAAVLRTSPVLTAVVAAVGFAATVAALVTRPAVRTAGVWWLTVASATVVFARIDDALTGPSAASPTGIPYGDLRSYLFYPTLAVGLVMVARRATASPVADALDVSVVSLSLFMLLWLFALNGQLPPAGGVVVVAAARPIGLAVVCGALVRLLFVRIPRAPALRFVIVGAIAAIAGGFAVVAQRYGYRVQPFVSNSGVLFAGYAALLGAAVLHPSASAPPVASRHLEERLRMPRIAMFIALALLGPLVWVVVVTPAVPFGVNSVADFALPVMASGLISVLLLWRLVLYARVADRRSEQLRVAVTDLERLRADLAYRATHDPLTGLANRSVLVEKLEAADRRQALLLLDLDGFKQVNDSLGHPVGDQLLIDVGRRIDGLTPSGATVVRLGGDEFAVLLPYADEAAALRLAERVCHALRQPYRIAGLDLFVSASIGVATHPPAGTSSMDVLRDADLALYAAKSAGKDRATAFRPELRETHEAPAVRGQAHWTRGEVDVCYEPWVDLATGRIAAVRAVPPPSNLDDGTLRRAAEECRPWFARHQVSLAIGVPDGALADKRTADAVLLTLDRCRLPYRALILEVSANGLAAAAAEIDRLRDHGVRVTVTDLPEPLPDLAGLPVDLVKTDTRNVAAVHSIQSSGVVPVATGVDSLATVQALRTVGYPLAAGPALQPTRSRAELDTLLLDPRQPFAAGR